MAEAAIAPPKRNGWKIFFYVLFLLAVLVFSTAGGWVSRSSVMTHMVVSQFFPKDPEKVFHRKSMNILILGCDQNIYWTKETKIVSDENTRSDLMLVAHLDFENKTITGLSIPRDLYVRMPGYEGMKINGFHAKGGTELAREAAEHVMGVQIDRVAKIDYQAFQDIVNMLDGVEVYVARDMQYTDRAADLFINLKQGRQTLDGYDAMCYVRYRKGDSDFVRQERQKEFALAMKERIKKNPARIPAIADKMLDLTSNAFTAEELVHLMRFAQNVGGDNVRLGMVPITEQPNDPQYRLFLDEDKLEESLQDYGFRPKPAATATTDGEDESA